MNQQRHRKKTLVLWDCVSMFSIEDEGLPDEEKNTSFYNKEAIFSAREGAVKFQMHVVDWLNVELFLFQLILQTMRSF